MQQVKPLPNKSFGRAARWQASTLSLRRQPFWCKHKVMENGHASPLSPALPSAAPQVIFTNWRETLHGSRGQTVDWNSSCAHGSSARAGLCWCCPRPERWSTDLAPLAGPICTRAAIQLTGKDGNVLPAVPTIHHVIDGARIFHSHGARHGAMRVGITAPGQAQNTIEKQPQTASLRRICWDQSTV
jgi:hypothetical protein